MKRYVFGLCILAAGVLAYGTSPALARHHSFKRHSTATTLQGTINARETRVFSNPDTGALYKWTGQGTVKPLGATSGTGTNHGVGFIREGAPTGTMTLSNAAGSIRLKITYDRTPGFAPLPSHAMYVITGGTGAYARTKGSGSLVRQQGACSNGTSTGLCPVGSSFAVTYQFNGATSSKT